jgi:hypothetical protein
MGPWKQAIREGAFAGSVATVLSTVALVLAGRLPPRHWHVSSTTS